jgi:3-phosphoshikimate 1-carboxyvinyltransferase
VNGTITAPASKSDAQRAIAAASLANGTSVISQYTSCDDSEAAIGIITDLGSSVSRDETRLLILGGSTGRPDSLDCGESGLSLRLFASVAALRNHPIHLKARGTLLNRPVRMVESALRQLHVDCRSEDGHPPLTVKGPLRSGTVQIDGSGSSQHISGLLFALPLIHGDSELIVADPRSTPYLQMTLSTLDRFGIRMEHDASFQRFSIPGGQSYKPAQYVLEGDWSGSAFLLVAGAIAGRITIKNLSTTSHQADRAIVDILIQCGASVKAEHETVTVVQRDLTAFRFDATDAPDLIPPLATLASCCWGTSVIAGSDRLKTKESNRVEALVKELTAIGVKIVERNGCLEVSGGPITGGTVHSHHDHRIAMAAAVAGLKSINGVEIEESGSVAKSYPAFFADLEHLIGTE